MTDDGSTCHKATKGDPAPVWEPSEMPGLSGKHFLVLRPKSVSEDLLRCFSESGVKVSHFPMFELEPANTSSLKEMTDTLPEANKVIFVSPSAVQFFFDHLDELDLKFPANAQCFSPGVSTTAALESRAGKRARHPDDVGDANALLAMPDFSGIEGQRVDIVGGESGSHQIIFELLRRGANASYVSCYRMRPSEPRSEEILDAHGALPFSAIVVHSNTALVGLARMLGEKVSTLDAVPVLTHHRAIEAAAKREGFKRVLLARNGKGEAIVELAEKEL